MSKNKTHASKVKNCAFDEFETTFAKALFYMNLAQAELKKIKKEALASHADQSNDTRA